MIPDDSIQDKQGYTPKELSLRELLSKRDETGKLSKMLESIIKVLRDIDNPMRCAQAANTIRCIADKLINRNNRNSISQSLLGEEDFTEIKEKFAKLLFKSVSKIKNKEDKNETIEQAGKNYDRLKNVLSRGNRTRVHQLVDLIGARGSNIVPEKLQEDVEQLANNYKYFGKVLHRHDENEPKFEDNWMLFQDFLIIVTSEFFNVVKGIEPFLKQETVNDGALSRLTVLISRPEHFEYFFKNLNRIDLFDWLNDKIHVFESIPEPMLTEDGQCFQFPSWWPGRYLIKVANKIPDKVLRVIKKIRTENPSAIDDCDRAILNMPDKFLADNYTEVIKLYDQWLDLKYQSRIKYDVDDLFGKFMRLECHDGAVELFDVLSKSRKDNNDVKFRFDVYYYKEILKKYLSNLTKIKADSILKIIEDRLKEAILMGQSTKDGDDDSTEWRRAIEDNPQNWGFDDPKEIFTEILRDTLIKKFELQNQDAKKVVERYLEEKYSIFRRLAIHCIRVRSLDDIAMGLMIEGNNLDKIEIHHEFFKLIEGKFNILSNVQKKQLIRNIIDVPMEKITKQSDTQKAEKYKRFWQTDRLLMIKKYIEEDEHLKEFRVLLKEYSDDFERSENPDFLSYHTGWTGPTSPLTKEQIQSKTPEEFLEWILENLQPPFGMMESTPEGLSRIFQEVVEEKCVEYAKVAKRYLVPGVFPAYRWALLHGLTNGIKNKKINALEPLLIIMEHELKFWEDPDFREIGCRESDIGKYQWVRGVISNVIEELVSRNDLILDEDFMDRTQKVLVELIEKDSHPTEEDEKKYGPEANNMNYVSYCINCNRGKAMCAFIQHARRRAEMRLEKEKKKGEGKGEFPLGDEIITYKDFLKKRLDEEKSPSVQSSYGRYLTYLYYLDSEWIAEMVKSGKLFPKGKERFSFWEGHWQGYVGFNNFTNSLYELLRRNYQKAVERLISDSSKKEKRERMDTRLAEHLMIAYWRELEDFGKGKNILDIFFKSAPTDIRGHAVFFLSTAIDKIKPKKESKEWGRLKKLWEHRIKNSRDEEIAKFVRWLKNCPEKIEDIKHLVSPMIKFLHKNFQERDFLEYLSVKAGESPFYCMELLNVMLNTDDSFYLHLEMLEEIFKKAYEFRSDSRVTQLINNAVNRLGEMGYYDFKCFLT